MRKGPKSAKNTDSNLTVFSPFRDYLCVKAAHRMLMKLSPRVDIWSAAGSVAGRRIGSRMGRQVWVAVMATIRKNLSGQTWHVNVFFQDAGLIVFAGKENKVVLRKSEVKNTLKLKICFRPGSNRGPSAC